MADQTEMIVVPPTLPPGFCNSPEQIIGLFNQLQVFFPGTFIIPNFGPNEPSIENRNRPWIKTDATTGVVVGVYAWAPLLGVWAKQHWVNNIPPFDERRVFEGDASDVDTFDGGSAGTVSASTGPFWEIDTNWADKGLIGVGGTHTPVATDFQVFDDAVIGDPKLRTVYMLKPTGRLYDTA